jgi:hypothetical protein
VLLAAVHHERMQLRRRRGGCVVSVAGFVGRLQCGEARTTGAAACIARKAPMCTFAHGATTYVCEMMQ